MNRAELNRCHIRGDIVFDRIEYWIKMKTGETLKEVYRLDRVFGRRRDEPFPSEYWSACFLTEEGTESWIDIPSNLFGAIFRPYLGISELATVSRALWDQYPDKRRAEK